MAGHYDKKKKNLGKSLPYFPNGWYIACKAKDLAPGEVKAIDIAGVNVTIFRNPNGTVYGL
jgi:phenylpropionate dioxygenase-like ring-hydroxylating dioxygenase large terminal subunit